MKLFGYEITKAKAQVLTSISSQSQWWSPLFGGFGGLVREPWTGAWQHNAVPIDRTEGILAFSAVFACVTGIAGDIAKCRIKLTENIDGIWQELERDSPWLPVLRKPNHYQNRIKFIEQWIVSKLLNGNSYALKERDNRGVVTRLYILDPNRVKVLVADNGDVYYELDADDLSQVEKTVIVPASEIIHDMMVSLWHPLIGVSPIYACGMSATMGNKIQTNSTGLFNNRSMPGGVLSAPGAISDPTAKRLKDYWEANFSGANVGRLAVLGDGLKYEQMTITAVDAQLIEQLKWTVDDVARAFHYPIWKLGGPMPTYASSPQTMALVYYTDCLQLPIECLELCLDEGLALPQNMGTEMDIDNLMRMDTGALYEANVKAGPWMTIDEQRQRANYPPLPIGGDTVYRQQQDFSIEALAKRDAQPNPFTPAAQPSLPPAPTPEPPKEEQKGMDLDEISSFCDQELVSL